MHHDLKAVRATLNAAHNLNAFEVWLRIDGDRLLEAAELFGGESWSVRAEAVLSEVTNGVSPVSLVVELSDMHRLLTLEFPDDLDSIGPALFISLRPDDLRADDARICVETLKRGLLALEAVAATERRAA